MSKCPYCSITIPAWRLKCPRCRNYVWRLPQILLGIFLLSAIVAGILFTVNYLAVKEDSTPKKVTVSTENVPAPAFEPPGSAPTQPGRSNPGQPRPDWKRQ